MARATGILLRARFTQAEVEQILDAARTELLNGAVRVSEWSSNQTSAKRFYQYSTEQIIEECVHALAVLDPDNHGQNEIPPFTRGVF